MQNRFDQFRGNQSGNLGMNLESRLEEAKRELRTIDENCCLLELASDDPEGIQGQLRHCLVSFRL